MLANKLVKHISLLSKKDVKKTNAAYEDVIGGFGSIFDISNINIKDPLIVSCTDRSELKFANKFKFDTRY